MSMIKSNYQIELSDLFHLTNLSNVLTDSNNNQFNRSNNNNQLHSNPNSVAAHMMPQNSNAITNGYLCNLYIKTLILTNF